MVLRSESIDLEQLVDTLIENSSIKDIQLSVHQSEMYYDSVVYPLMVESNKVTSVMVHRFESDEVGLLSV